MTTTTTEDRSLTELLRLDGRVAVVTGAAQGIGLALTRRLSEAGAHVVLADIDQQVHKESKTLADQGHQVSSATLDARQEDDHLRLVDDTLRQHGRLDIWVNNAGIYPAHPTLELSAEDWHRVVSLNLDGSFFGARAAARVMTERGTGVILNVGSTSGFRVSNDGVAHYAASKSGIRGLTQALAREFGPHGVRVLGIAPTFTLTQTTLDSALSVAQVQDPDMTQEQFLERYTSKIPLRRAATPDDMALVATFCVSDLANYLTGSIIPVDGGFLSV